MSPRSAAKIAFGVAGAYLVAVSVPQALASVAAGLLGRDHDPVIRWIAIIAPVVTAVTGSGMIALRKAMSARLVPETQEQVSDSGVTGAQGAAISVVGVYFLATGTAGLARELLRSLVPQSRFGAALSIDACAGPLAEFAVGLSLFLGARGIVSVWGEARTAGRNNPS